MTFTCPKCDGYYAICKRCKLPGTRCNCGRKYKAISCPECAEGETTEAVAMRVQRPVGVSRRLMVAPEGPVLVRHSPSLPAVRRHEPQPSHTWSAFVLAAATVFLLFGFLLKGTSFGKHVMTDPALSNNAPKHVRAASRLGIPCAYCIGNKTAEMGVQK